MGKIEWDSSLSVCVELIDDQHRMMIGKMNDIHDAVEQGLGPAKVMETLEFMFEYTQFHFSTEEKHMDAQNYPGTDAHKQAHAEFIAMVKNLSNDFEDEGSTEGLAQAVDTYLKNWLIKHIQGTDVEFATFLNDKGVCLQE